MLNIIIANFMVMIAQALLTHGSRAAYVMGTSRMSGFTWAIPKIDKHPESDTSSTIAEHPPGFLGKKIQKLK